MVEIVLKCDECGNELSGDFGTTAVLYVEPCEKCVDSAFGDGESAGYSKGFDEGRDDVA